MFSRLALPRWLLPALAALFATAVLARAEPVNFNLPAQNAPRALLAFSRQARTDVLFFFEQLKNVRSNRVRGKYEPGQALDLLLNGTGFRAKDDGRGKFVVLPVKVAAAAVVGRSAKPAAAAPDEPARLDPFVVNGQSEPSEPLGHALARNGEPTAAGNLDLPRSEDDALPYEIHGRDEIARSGVVNLDQFLERELLESDASTAPPEDDGSQPAYVAGSNNLNLRGYGTADTVVLINGRRLPAILNNLAGNSSSAQSPDVDLIPLDLVEKIEVLPVSASALYSGNPVGGVINIVLRPQVTGTEVSATYTNALHSFDAPQSSLSLLHGETLLGGKLSVRLSATYTEAVPPTEAELGYIRAYNQAHPNLAATLYRATPNVQSANGSPLFGPGTPNFTSVAPGASGAGGLAAFDGREGVPSLNLFQAPGGMADSPNSLDYTYGRSQQAATYFASATYDLFPRLQLGFDGIYSQSVAHRGYDVQTGDLNLAANSPLNPFHQALTVTLNEAAPLLGENYDEARVDYATGVLGLVLKLPADWDISADAQYGYSLTRYRGISGVDTARWQQLVDTGVYNPLRDTQVYGPPQAFYDSALIYFGHRGEFVTLGDYDVLDTDVRVTNSSLALPTGTATVNVGGDYELDHLTPYVDDRRYGDGSLADGSGIWTGRSLQQLSGFAEAQVPLLPVAWLPRAIRTVEADVAARYDAANTAQATNVAPTAALKIDWAQGWSLRGSVSTTNRFPAPILSGFVPTAPAATGGTGEASTAQIFDPKLNNDEESVLASDALNPILRPEADITRSVGLFFQRGRVHRLRLSVDFFDTRTSGEIYDLAPQDVVDLEGELPGRVTRAPPSAGDPNGVGPVISVLTGDINLAWRHSQNWTTLLEYAWTECRGGTLEVYGRWVHYSLYERQLLPNTPVVDELNDPDTASGSPELMKNRINFGAGWSDPDFGFGLDGRYYSARLLPTDEWANQGSRQIDPYCQFGAYLQGNLARWIPWKLAHFGLRGQLRVDNVFSARYPAYAEDPSGAGVQAYGDWRGRTYSFSLTAKY